MIVKINGKEIFRFENSVPGIYKNVTVSHSYEGIDYDYVTDDGQIYTYDYEEEYGEFPASDISIKNFKLKSYDFPISVESLKL